MNESKPEPPYCVAQILWNFLADIEKAKKKQLASTVSDDSSAASEENQRRLSPRLAKKVGKKLEKPTPWKKLPNLFQAYFQFVVFKLKKNYQLLSGLGIDCLANPFKRHAKKTRPSKTLIRKNERKLRKTPLQAKAKTTVVPKCDDWPPVPSVSSTSTSSKPKDKIFGHVTAHLSTSLKTALGAAYQAELERVVGVSSVEIEETECDTLMHGSWIRLSKARKNLKEVLEKNRRKNGVTTKPESEIYPEARVELDYQADTSQDHGFKIEQDSIANQNVKLVEQSAKLGEQAVNFDYIDKLLGDQGVTEEHYGKIGDEVVKFESQDIKLEKQGFKLDDDVIRCDQVIILDPESFLAGQSSMDHGQDNQDLDEMAMDAFPSQTDTEYTQRSDSNHVTLAVQSVPPIKIESNKEDRQNSEQMYSVTISAQPPASQSRQRPDESSPASKSISRELFKAEVCDSERLLKTVPKINKDKFTVSLLRDNLRVRLFRDPLVEREVVSGQSKENKQQHSAADTTQSTVGQPRALSDGILPDKIVLNAGRSPEGKRRTPKSSPMKCHRCLETFRFRCDFLYHLDLLTCKKRYPCPMCDKTFVRACSIGTHMCVHTGKQPHTCDVCNATYPSKYQLKQHKKLHANPFTCDVCGELFPSQERLNKHSVVHRKRKWFCCKECDQIFTSRSRLSHHVAVHFVKERYKCDHCNKRFRMESSLRWHKKRYGCGQSTTDRSDFKLAKVKLSPLTKPLAMSAYPKVLVKRQKFENNIDCKT